MTYLALLNTCSLSWSLVALEHPSGPVANWVMPIHVTTEVSTPKCNGTCHVGLSPHFGGISQWVWRQLSRGSCPSPNKETNAPALTTSQSA